MIRRCLLALVFAAIVAGPALSQTGLVPFGSFQQGKFDTVNLQNLNVMFSVPIYHSQGRGFDFDYRLNYNSISWVNGGGGWIPGPLYSGLQYGWSLSGPAGSINVYVQSASCEYQDPASGMFVTVTCPRFLRSRSYDT